MSEKKPISWVLQSVPINLDRPCPTCGSEVYGNDGDKSQLTMFLQRLQFAQEIVPDWRILATVKANPTSGAITDITLTVEKAKI
jgi:hypothetical protein